MSEIPLQYQVKHTKLQNAVELAQQRLDSADKRLTKNPGDHNEYLRDCAKAKLLEVQNELSALEKQIEVEEATQEEKTKKDDEAAADIVTGLRRHFGDDRYEESVIKYGEPVEATQFGWALNDAWWGAILLLDRNILYSPGYAEFYEYHANNGLWTPRTENKLTSDLHTLLVELNRKIFHKASILKHVDEKFRHEAVKAQRGYTENKEAFIKKKPDHIQVQNGVLDLTGGEITLKPFSPSYYSLYASPLAYDPEAKCPEFEQLLAHLDPDDRELIQRAAGMFLIGRNLFQKIFIFEDETGSGGTRKTTITKLFGMVIGEDLITQLRTNLLDDRFEFFQLYQKSLLVGSDVKPDFLTKDGAGALKKLTGGDHLRAEGKHIREGFGFEGNLNVLINANGRLLLRLLDDAGAWERRIVLLIFPSAGNRQEVKPEYWNELFQKEGTGILRWMVAGAQRLLQDKADGKGFVMTPAQKERVVSRLQESDALNVFLKTHITQSDDHHDGIPTEDLILAYNNFCRTKDWKHSRITLNQLKDTMLEYGGEYSNHVRKPGSMVEGRGYAGVKWTTPPPVPPAAGTGNGSAGDTKDAGSLAVSLKNRMKNLSSDT
jgi:P4 family phage/plasmid primase-like protien